MQLAFVLQSWSDISHSSSRGGFSWRDGTCLSVTCLSKAFMFLIFLVLQGVLGHVWRMSTGFVSAWVISLATEVSWDYKIERVVWEHLVKHVPNGVSHVGDSLSPAHRYLTTVWITCFPPTSILVCFFKGNDKMSKVWLWHLVLQFQILGKKNRYQSPKSVWNLVDTFRGHICRVIHV